MASSVTQPVVPAKAPIHGRIWVSPCQSPPGQIRVASTTPASARLEWGFFLAGLQREIQYQNAAGFQTDKYIRRGQLRCVQHYKAFMGNAPESASLTGESSKRRPGAGGSPPSFHSKSGNALRIFPVMGKGSRSHLGAVTPPASSAVYFCFLIPAPVAG